MSSICMKVRENHSLQKRACVTILLLRVLVSQYCYTGHLCHTIVTRGTCVTLLLHGMLVSHYCYTGYKCQDVVTIGGVSCVTTPQWKYSTPSPQKKKTKTISKQFQKKKKPTMCLSGQCAFTYWPADRRIVGFSSYVQWVLANRACSTTEHQAERKKKKE